MEEDTESVWQIALVCVLVALLLIGSLVCMCVSWRAILHNERWCVCQICCLILLRCRNTTTDDIEDEKNKDDEDGYDTHVRLCSKDGYSSTTDMMDTNDPERHVV